MLKLWSAWASEANRACGHKYSATERNGPRCQKEIGQISCMYFWKQPLLTLNLFFSYISTQIPRLHHCTSLPCFFISRNTIQGVGGDLRTSMHMGPILHTRCPDFGGMIISSLLPRSDWRRLMRNLNSDTHAILLQAQTKEKDRHTGG